MMPSAKKTKQHILEQRLAAHKKRRADTGLLLIVIGIVLLTLALNLSSRRAGLHPQSSETKNSREVMTREKLAKQRAAALADVNFYLKKLDQKVEQDRAYVELQNQQLALRSGQTGIMVDPQEDGPLVERAAQTMSLKQEGLVEKVFEDIRGENFARTRDDLQQPLNDYLADHQEAEIYNAAYRKAYVERYLEAMLEAGYIVKLNKDLEVIEIRPTAKAGSSAGAIARGNGHSRGYGYDQTNGSQGYDSSNNRLSTGAEGLVPSLSGQK